VWCSEHYDPRSIGAASAAAAVAPSSCPKAIYDTLTADWTGEDRHSASIKNYRKTFKRLAKGWVADKSITEAQRAEIVATVDSNSFRIWRPVLYLVPKEPIARSGRLIPVPVARRAAYGPEWQIADLHVSEFDVIER
jgi:hypothetical protein